MKSTPKVQMIRIWLIILKNPLKAGFKEFVI